MSEGKTDLATASDEALQSDEVSNNLLEYFGPAIVAPLVVALYYGSAPMARILAFVLLYAAITVVFPIGLWLSRRFERGNYEQIDKLWYVGAALLNAAFPWIVRPEPRWSHFLLALTFCAITSSDTLTVSLRPEHRWKSLLALISSSYALFLFLNGSWLIALYCLAYGLHLSGGHDAVQGVVRHLRDQRHHSDQLAATDPLTGLRNRRGLNAFVREAEREGAKRLIVVAVDIDDFKQINDRFGHHGGDQALVHLSAHMQATFGPGWLVCRSGGDEFTCISTDGTVEEARTSLLRVPSFICEDTVVTPKVSVGVAVGPPDDSLLRDASAALRRSKHDGKHRVTEVDDDLRRELRQARRLGGQLADAVHRGEIEIWAQPIVRLHPGGVEVHSYECLARWATPEGVSVPPSTFIPIIEDQRLTRELGENIIEKAAAFAAALDDDISVAVNVAATHFAGHGFVEFLHRTIATHKIKPSRLTLELTESETLPSDAGSWATARQLAEMGVGLAVDDFGTGYASLERLVQFPHTQLKLDRSIVANAQGSGLEFVLEGFGKMSQETNVEIVAEGVEQKSQADLLRRLGIGLAQGFHFGRPQPVQQILAARLASAAEPLPQMAIPETAAESPRSIIGDSHSGRRTRASQPSDSAR